MKEERENAHYFIKSPAPWKWYESEMEDTGSPSPAKKEKYNIQMTKDFVSGCFSNLLAYLPSSPSFQFLQRNPHHIHLLPSTLSLWHTSNFLWRDFFKPSFLISLFYIPATVYSLSSPPSFEIESAEVIEAS